MTVQVLVRLPEALAKRLKRAAAPRQHSKFIAAPLEEALPPDESGDDDPLYQAALAVEQDEALAAKMGEWEAAALGDGCTSRVAGQPDHVTSVLVTGIRAFPKLEPSAWMAGTIRAMTI